jgi:hypothetical protein
MNAKATQAMAMYGRCRSSDFIGGVRKDYNRDLIEPLNLAAH